MILKLENTTTHQLYEYEVKDMNNGEKLYFRFDINTSNLVDGEYILSLYDGEKLVANDLLKIGDYNPSTLQYKKGENTYINVTLDNSVQGSKTVVIETIDTTITPDDGFNSMGKVDVNAQPLYDNAYHIGHNDGYNEGLESSYQVGYDDGYSIGNEEGYNSGYNVGNEDGYKQGKTDGINTQKSKLETISITNNGTYEREDGYNKIIVDVPDTNGSYDEGYAEGISNGLAQGEINGINIQKDKLESITITENGTYTREDGYNSIEVNIEDTNGSYDEGYADGIEEGKSVQKALLTPITITENGTYTKEDGYNSIEVNVPDLNGSYDEGYSDGYLMGEDKGYDKGYADGIEEGTSNAGSIIAETARVLNITENGTYLSKYSEPPTPDAVTGVYPDGTVFYNYAELNGKVFNTNITATPTARLEMWYKGDNTWVEDSLNIIIGAGKIEYSSDTYHIRYDVYSNDKINVGLGYYNLYHTWDENAWHHILIAKETEDAAVLSLWVDEVKVGDFGKLSFNPNSTFYINGIEYNLNKTANGCFGMIKIDDTIIIPTADGFFNTNTGELLEVIKVGGYAFTDNTPQVPEGNLIKTVNVNVQPKIDIEKEGIKFARSSITTVPEWADFSNITNMSYMFYCCKNLTTIPLIDTSNVINMDYMFRECSNLTSVPKFNTSNVTNISYMFYGCSNLTTIPELDTSNVTNMESMFEDCSITTIPELDTSKVKNVNRMFYGCSNLTSVPPLNAQNITSSQMFGYSELTKLTDFGGLIGLKVNFNGSYSFNKCPNLTYQSCINILNGLADVTELGSRTLKVHKNFIDLVGDEISIGTAKNWVITT